MSATPSRVEEPSVSAGRCKNWWGSHTVSPSNSVWVAAERSIQRGAASSAVHKMAATEAYYRGAIRPCPAVDVTGRAREGLFVAARRLPGGWTEYPYGASAWRGFRILRLGC